MDRKWYHVRWPRLTAKRVEPVVSISWASCYDIRLGNWAGLFFEFWSLHWAQVMCHVITAFRLKSTLKWKNIMNIIHSSTGNPGLSRMGFFRYHTNQQHQNQRTYTREHAHRHVQLSITQNCDHFQTCFKDRTFCHSIRYPLGLAFFFTRLRFARDLWRFTNVFWLIDWFSHRLTN